MLHKANRPIVWLPLGLATVALVVSPWGNYPVNDDWQYARVVKHLAETGRFMVDVNIAPSLAGHALARTPDRR